MKTIKIGEKEYKLDLEKFKKGELAIKYESEEQGVKVLDILIKEYDLKNDIEYTYYALSDNSWDAISWDTDTYQLVLCCSEYKIDSISATDFIDSHTIKEDINTWYRACRRVKAVKKYPVRW